MKTKKMVLTALFIALSFVGANLKVMGTIAFDSMPGFLGTLILGPVYGMLIGALGHLLTAATSGFPLTLPVHIVVMVDMALTMYIFGIIFRRFANKNMIFAVISSSIAGVIINGPIALLMCAPLMLKVMPKAAIIGMTPVLSGVAALNIVIAFLVYKFLPKEMKKNESM